MAKFKFDPEVATMLYFSPDPFEIGGYAGRPEIRRESESSLSNYAEITMTNEKTLARAVIYNIEDTTPNSSLRSSIKGKRLKVLAVWVPAYLLAGVVILNVLAR